jgi:hypothetical protein
MDKINLIFFMTTKGHFGRNNLYKYSLKNFNSFNLQDLFDKYLSIKVFKGDEKLGEEISKEINYNTFTWYNPDPKINNDSPYKDYAYYLLTNYLADIVNLYSQENLLNNEYTFIYEDDSPIIINNNNFQYYIEEAKKKLEKNSDIFSVHFQRIGLFKDSIEYNNIDIKSNFTEPHDYNFQNQLLRTKDMFKVAQLIKENWQKLQYIHTERAVKLGINLLNQNFKHISFNPKDAHSIHIGTEDADKWISSYNL